MDLNWVKLNGFKRFEKATLDTSGKLIALVGANEAGKSSILEALTFLNHDGAFNKDIHLTRNKEFADDDVVIEAGFYLSDRDRELVADIYDDEIVKWLTIQKPVSGKRNYLLGFGSINSHCSELVDNLTFFYRFFETIDRYEPYAVEQAITIGEYISLWNIPPIIKVLKSENNSNLAREQSAYLSELLSKIPGIVSDISLFLEVNNSDYDDIGFEHPLPNSLVLDYVKGIQESVANFFDYQDILDKKEQKAVEIIKNSIPKFLLFNQAERDLNPTFNISTLDKTKPNKALENLLKLTGTDIDKLSESIKTQHILQSIVNKANIKLQKIYHEKWSQAKVQPVLNVNAYILRVSVINQEGENFELNQRSEGLRQFTALINFLEVEHAEQPILLVDEAELHLHYDAQADLMKIFSQQQFASKIIYTTHSVGCLPEDLGTGVKLVAPIENEDNEERSEIIKNFWSKDKRPGLMPLLFGMGASQLAFMTIRQSVFVEGASDMLLLPTLFRQAIKKDYLGFQIIQGIAETKRTKYGLLENHAPVVAFLVDNDGAGKEYRRDLIEAGIDEARIFDLPDWNEALVLEDYIRKDLYLEIVNSYIRKWNSDDVASKLMSLDDIPQSDRPLAVKEWCKKHSLKKIPKVDIAYCLLDFATGERQETLIEDSLVPHLSKLHENILTILNK